MPHLQNGTLHYEVRGEGTPILMLHPFPLSGAIFDEQTLLARGARLVIPDLRGFGKSKGGAEGSSGPLTMEALAADALAVMDAEKLQAAIVLGVSMGGYAALALAEAARERVSGLVLVDTNALADGADARASRERLALAVLARGGQALVEALLPRLLGPDAPPEFAVSVAAQILANSPASAVAALRGMALRPNREHVLRGYVGPALVVVGGADVISPPPVAKAMCDQLPRGELVEIAGAGHLSHYEAPDAFDRAVLEWLRRANGA